MPPVGSIRLPAYRANRPGPERPRSGGVLERARIAIARHNPAQASSLLSELEPLMRKSIPPTHYAFASLAAERAMVAMEQGDLESALKFSDQAVSIGEASLKKRGAGTFWRLGRRRGKAQVLHRCPPQKWPAGA